MFLPFYRLFHYTFLHIIFTQHRTEMPRPNVLIWRYLVSISENYMKQQPYGWMDYIIFDVMYW